MKDKVQIIAFFTTLIGFGVLLASFAMRSEEIGIVALFLILPSITLNLAMWWINTGDLEIRIKISKDKMSMITFFGTLIGFVMLVASVVTSSEKTGIAALLLILPLITLNIAMRWLNTENEDYFIKDNYNA